MILSSGWEALDIGGENMDLEKFIHSDMIYSKCSDDVKKEIDKELKEVEELKKENEILLKRIADLEGQRWSR